MNSAELRDKTLCVQCGPNVAVDEDGCCGMCGAQAFGPWADKAAAALERLEALEGELRLCRSFHEVAMRQRDSAWAEARALHEYYDAAEQAEYAGRQLGTAAQAQAASRLETARAALRATPAPAPQQGGES